MADKQIKIAWDIKKKLLKSGATKVKGKINRSDKVIVLSGKFEGSDIEIIVERSKKPDLNPLLSETMYPYFEVPTEGMETILGKAPALKEYLDKNSKFKEGSTYYFR